jgi:hypothetical protein
MGTVSTNDEIRERLKALSARVAALSDAVKSSPFNALPVYCGK